jgi:hypothetical protein
MPPHKSGAANSDGRPSGSETRSANRAYVRSVAAFRPTHVGASCGATEIAAMTPGAELASLQRRTPSMSTHRKASNEHPHVPHRLKPPEDR